MRHLCFRATALACLAMGGLPDAIRAQAPEASHVVTVDYVRARPGELPRLLRYYQLNWARSRRLLQQQGALVGYRLLVRADTLGDWDIELHTEYPDSAAYGRREEMFSPVLRAQGRTLVDGLDRAALGDIVASRLFLVAPAAP